MKINTQDINLITTSDTPDDRLEALEQVTTRRFGPSVCAVFFFDLLQMTDLDQSLLNR